MRLRSILAAVFAIGLAATTALPADAATAKNGYLVFSQEFTKIVTQSPNAGSYVFLTTGLNPKYSPDGQRLAYARDEESFPGSGIWVERLYIRDLARGLETVVAEFSQDITERSPDWAPDGASLVYTEGRSLYKVVIATGVRTVIWSSATLNLFQPSYAPDGSRIAFITEPPGGTGSAIVTIKPDGTGLHTVTAAAAGVSNYYPDWSPDSAKIAFVTNRYDHSHNEIVTLPRNGSGTPFRVSHLSHPTTHELAGVAWSPNGNKIAGLEAYPEYLPGEGPFDERRVVRGYAPDGSSSAPLTGPIVGDGTGNPPGLDWAPKVS
jgi:dipeptidyl aminopeptidase/acylaminoacyl peptidase